MTRTWLAGMMVVAALLSSGCVLTQHAAQPSALGTPRRSAELLAVLGQPGPIELQTIAAADWQVDRSGLIDLHDARARAAGLRDGLEPIQVYFHVLRHPTRGTFIVDSGVERALRDDRPHAAIRGLLARYMHAERMQIRVALADWLAQERTPLAGVFLTHLHLDHVSGLPDVPRGTPLYAGPGETRARALTNLVVRPNIDRALASHAPVSEWPFAGDADGRFAGVVDVFGDGSLWALWTPGHTVGSTAYIVRTPHGPVLLTGDTSHTAWGWQHDVPPGSYSADRRRNAESLTRLKALVAAHPRLEVRLGHQENGGAPSIGRAAVE